MEKETHFVELDESKVLRLPYFGPLSRRIYVVTQKENSTETEELFVQRNDAFTTNLVGLLNRLEEQEISEIRYLTGYDGLVRILLNEEGKLTGEYSCKSEKSLLEFKRKLEIP